MASKADTARALVAGYGRTFAREAGIRLRDTPAPLFRLLGLSALLSARIPADTAVSAARALAGAGWTTPAKMQAATWRQRTDTLNAAGYARYDESTARMLGDATDLLVERYGGDLRRLRDQGGGRTDDLRRLLTEFKGIGDVGADIFLREVQGVWSEVLPFADRRVLEVARQLGLGDGARALRRLVDSDADYVKLSAALVRVGLARGTPGEVVGQLVAGSTA
ncbi:MAG TPA: hypothetical protein VNT56_00275 [Acidimicrobiales bacterium]|nr:hypothetical protein [Acidimicrobiales bacterium]